MHVVLSPPVPLRTAAASATLRAGGAAFLSHPWRGRALALAGLYGGICLFFGLVWVTGRAESPLSLASSGVFLTLRLLAVGAGFWKLRQARFDVRQPLHWMLLVFTLSMLLASAGTLTWLTYNWVGVLVPYPSLADLGFGGHTLLWAVGLFLLYAALGTTPREEVGPFLGLLTATWSLTVVLIRPHPWRLLGDGGVAEVGARHLLPVHVGTQRGAGRLAGLRPAVQALHRPVARRGRRRLCGVPGIVPDEYRLHDHGREPVE